MEMTLDQFAEWASSEILNHLPESYRQAQINVFETVKMNEKYLAMTVRNEGENSAALINLSRCYEDYRNQMPLDRIAARIANTIRTERLNVSQEQLLDYETVKKNLFVRLSNEEHNRELLERVPHRQIQDLVVTYHILIHDREESIASTVITNRLLESYGISESRLYSDAMENAVKLMPPMIDDMENHLLERHGDRYSHLDQDLPEDEQRLALVVTNENVVNGAAVLLYPGIMESLSHTFGGSYYLIPSSIHEWIAVSEKKVATSVYEMEETLHTVNRSMTVPSEQLSDHLYHYDQKEKLFELASVYEERKHSHTLDELIGQASDLQKESNRSSIFMEKEYVH